MVNLLGLDPSAPRFCLSAAVKVCLSEICFLQHGLLSCLEKMLIKKEIELPKVNYCVPWLSLESGLTVDVIIMGKRGGPTASILQQPLTDIEVGRICRKHSPES